MPLVERHLPADFRWKGNRRKRALRAPTAVRPGRAEGRSLDSSKQLATSRKTVQEAPQTLAQELKGQTDARDRNRRAWSLHNALMDTLKGMALMEEGLKRLHALDELKGDAPLTKQRRSRSWSASKDLERLSGCQSEWIGFRPTCCGSAAVAVPIGCNHRLCPLCNAHRAERYRSRVLALFGTLSNPQLLTLTVPSPRNMSREVLDTLRTRLRAFLKAHKSLLKGGVYSIEVTYNSREKTWHPHVHILVDVNDDRVKLPWQEFVERKWRLEFEWFLLTQGKREGKRRWRASDWDEWSGGCDARGKRRGPFAGDHRRIVDLRPVTKDRQAAFEVMKYMAKAASFIGDPDALRQLLVALKGVRQIQTFGNCYGFSLDEEMVYDERKKEYRKAHLHERKEHHLRCGCGANVFERIGVLGLGMVKLAPDGTWYVRNDAPVHGRQRCREHPNHRSVGDGVCRT